MDNKHTKTDQKNKCERIVKGDDTMSATTQNFIYEVSGKKSTNKSEPTLTKEKLEAIKASVGKYLFGKEE